ncbi:MAG TPA: hypothetical protein VFO69_13510 [Allosphingosinicella sp.]|nr:hypothetical protein [Allosphingosinicella sp.]
MRILAFIVSACLLAGCEPEAETPTLPANRDAPPPTNVGQPQPEIPSTGEGVGNVATLPVDPPNDPALAAMSASRRREYERGYRDCIRGDYAYDPERQGESYRIGCMAAENVKAGGDR